MNLELIRESFLAFNQNAAHHIAYQFRTNWWLIIFVVATIVCVILGVKEQSQSVVKEEQNIL